MVSAGVDAWKWPSKDDILFYFMEDIKCLINQPIAKNSRGHYNVPEMKNFE